MTEAQRIDLRRTRERELVQATRALFDERGILHAPVEEIARNVGIARGLIYRQFASKDELYVLTATEYLADLEPLLAAAVAEPASPPERLEALVEAYAGFCGRYPAFIDITLSLMHGPAGDLRAAVSDSVWLRLGRSMGTCIGYLTRVLTEGAQSGDFAVEDPDLMATILWTQVLGAMHLARSGVGVSEQAPGVPRLFRVEPERVVASCVQSALATVRPARP